MRDTAKATTVYFILQIVLIALTVTAVYNGVWYWGIIPFFLSAAYECSAVNDSPEEDNHKVKLGPWWGYRYYEVDNPDFIEDEE